MREGDFHRAIGDDAALPPHPRFAVYRSNVRAALVNALRLRYPLTARALGDDAFLRIAGDFTAVHKPASPVLIHYGAAFPDHLAPQWLADVARVESAWWQAYHAAEAMPLSVQQLQAIGADALLDARLCLHPAMQLLALATAAGARWQALAQGIPFRGPDVPQCLVVVRPDAAVELRIVPRATFDFLSALRRYGSVAAAAQGISDLSGQLEALLGSRIICGVNRDSAD